ncbi:hypothetical protein AB0E69_11525 [Kribbella sp. NPDC026611]|uniref:hypothetical protein n=1 Tax=Kribbella sp. NPDC026611 TaxID=3154911 RepID=UPI0033E760F0
MTTPDDRRYDPAVDDDRLMTEPADDLTDRTTGTAEHQASNVEASGDLTRDDLPRDDRSTNDLATNDLARDDLARDDLARDDLASDDLGRNDLAADDLATHRTADPTGDPTADRTGDPTADRMADPTAAERLTPADAAVGDPNDLQADERDVAGSGPAVDEPLVASGASVDYRLRWDVIQQGFVDDPRNAVTEADKLVDDLLKHLADGFDRQHRGLEQQWSDGEPSTEDLRTALQRYRTFFQRLLTI